jgi:hypothetical protein
VGKMAMIFFVAREADDLICKENDVGDSCSSWRFVFVFFFQGRISYWC